MSSVVSITRATEEAREFNEPSGLHRLHTGTRLRPNDCIAKQIIPSVWQCHIEKSTASRVVVDVVYIVDCVDTVDVVEDLDIEDVVNIVNIIDFAVESRMDGEASLLCSRNSCWSSQKSPGRTGLKKSRSSSI